MCLDRWRHIVALRFRTLRHRDQLDRELDEELRYHVEQLTAQYVGRGLSSERARREALAAMGGLTRRREEMRAARGFGLLADLHRDLRYALRSLGRTPGFTVVAVLTLALGIAASAAVFSLVDAALFRPPPFAEARRLMVLNITQRTAADGLMRVRWSWPRLQLLMAQARSFDGIASSSNVVVTITGAEDPEPLPIEIVSANYFGVMGARVALGHGFSIDDDDPATAAPVLVISHGLWQDRFGGTADIVGRPVEINGVTMTVAGVGAPDFSGVSGLARAWVPVAFAPALYYPGYLTTNENFITAIGRLRAGVTEETAGAELAVLGPRIHAERPSESDGPDDEFSAALVSLNDARVDVTTRRALLLLAAAAGVLLLIACANVASLLLGRAAARRREIGVRLAIGASRGRLVRQLLAESAVLAGAAGLAGIALTVWATTILRIPPTLARGRNFYGAVGEFATPGFDWRVLSFVVAVTALTVLLCGLVPALRATRTDVANDLKSGASRPPASGRRLGLREAIVATQLAMSVILLVGCGLLLASYTRLQGTPLGFDPARLLTFMVRPSEVRYPPAAAPALIDRILDEVRRVPGVQAVSVDGCAPLSQQCARAMLRVAGRPWAATSDAPIVQRHYVAPDHFRTLGITVERGRPLLEHDRAGQPGVVVINRTAAERFWPGQDPIGQRVWFDGAASFGSEDASAEVVGIVSDAAYRPLDEDPVQPSFFTSYAQFTYASRMVLLRTADDPLALVPAIRRAVRQADPSLALFDVRTMEERARISWSKQSFQVTLLGTIAAIALVLAVTGVYAVTAWFVASRRRDIGVHMALGATNLRIARTALAGTIRLGAIGLAAGLAGALAIGRLLRASLYETPWLDPVVLLGVGAVLLVALVVATLVPVRRAVRVSPGEVLRSE